MGVRVPRITINADFGDDSAFGELNALSIGYGLHQAWVFTAIFNATTFYGTHAMIEGFYNTHVTLTHFVSIVVYALFLLFAGLTDQKFLQLYVSKRVLTAGALLCSIGTLCLLFPFGSTSPYLEVIEIIAGVLTGIGSAILLLFWGTAFARCDASSIVLNTGVAITVSMAVYCAALNLLPFPFAGLFIGIVPLLELAILYKYTPDPFDKRNELPIFKPLPVNHAKFIARFGLPVFAFGLALGMMRQISVQFIIPASDTSVQLVILLGGGFATILVLLAIIALGGADKWNVYFRPLIPFIALTVLLIPVSATGNTTFIDFLLITGYLCFEALLWIFFGEISQRFRLSPIFVFGIGRGLLAVAILTASLLPGALVSWLDSTPFREEIILMAAMAVMVLAYALLPREREIEAIVIPCPLVRQVYKNIDQTSANAQSAPNFIQASATEQPLATANTKPSTETSATGMPIQNTAATTHPTAQTESPASAAQPQTETTTLQGTHDSQVSDARRAMLGQQLRDDSSDQKRGRFRAKCETVANTYFLSRRETEVMFFLAKGHNSSYIQEKLFISEGTAKTHIRHIYRKLDVHTQQELMRLVESADTEE